MRTTTNYMTRHDIARLFGRGRTWVYHFIKGLEDSGRYPSEEIINDGFTVLIPSEIVLDWIKVRKQVERGELVKPFRGIRRGYKC